MKLLIALVIATLTIGAINLTNPVSYRGDLTDEGQIISSVRVRFLRIDFDKQEFSLGIIGGNPPVMKLIGLPWTTLTTTQRDPKTYEQILVNKGLIKGTVQ